MIPSPMAVACTLGDGIHQPVYARDGDAGLDLRSAELLTLAPHTWRLIGTGVRVAIPRGYAGFVTPRSGLAANWGITVLNAPGLIDSGYRGEVRVLLYNASGHDYHVEPGARIAQLVIVPVVEAELFVVDELPETERGDGGFGSTGVADVRRPE